MCKSIKLKQLKTKDLLPLRKKLYNKNNGICPLLNTKVDFEQTVIDHIHKLNDEECSTEKGVIRNCIEFRANAIEGKIVNNWKRYFGSDESKHPISLPDFLRNLADYLEKGAYIDDDTCYIHPSEAPKIPKIKKSSFNKMIKLFKEKYPKKKLPEYPKSSKLTKRIKCLFEEFEIEDFFYK